MARDCHAHHVQLIMLGNVIVEWTALKRSIAIS